MQAYPAVDRRCQDSGIFSAHLPYKKARSLEVAGLVSLLHRVVCKQWSVLVPSALCLPPQEGQLREGCGIKEAGVKLVCQFQKAHSFPSSMKVWRVGGSF